MKVQSCLVAAVLVLGTSVAQASEPGRTEVVLRESDVISSGSAEQTPLILPGASAGGHSVAGDAAQTTTNLAERVFWNTTQCSHARSRL